MRAKQIFEVFDPKSREDIKHLLKKYPDITYKNGEIFLGDIQIHQDVFEGDIKEKIFDRVQRYKRVIKYLKEEKNAKIESLYSDGKISIKLIEVVKGNWHIGDAFNDEDANKIVDTHKLYDVKNINTKYSVEDQHSHSFFSLEDIESIMSREYKIKNIDVGNYKKSSLYF